VFELESNSVVVLTLLRWNPGLVVRRSIYSMCSCMYIHIYVVLVCFFFFVHRMETHQALAVFRVRLLFHRESTTDLDTGSVRLEFDCVPSEKSAGHESNLSLSTGSYRRKSMTMPGDAMLLSSWQLNCCEFDTEVCSESEHDDPVHERGEAPVPDLEIERDAVSSLVYMFPTIACTSFGCSRLSPRTCC